MSLRLDPYFVLNDLSTDELTTLLEYSYLAHKDSYEQSRFNAYITAQCNSTKPINIQDIQKFRWETNEENTDIDEETKQRLQSLSEFYIDRISDLVEVENEKD